MLSIRSVVNTPSAHSRTSDVRAGTIRAAARGTRSETVARARELRSPSSAGVDARRRAEAGATFVSLHDNVIVFFRMLGILFARRF